MNYVYDKRLEGIAEVRDESDRTGLRIVIELKKDVRWQKVFYNIYIKIRIYKSRITLI